MKNNSLKIIRNHKLAPKVVFVDGLAGCGKTMFTSILRFSVVHKKNCLQEPKKLDNTMNLSVPKSRKLPRSAQNSNQS